MDKKVETDTETAGEEPAENEKQIAREHLAQELGQIVLKFLGGADSQKLGDILSAMAAMQEKQDVLAARVKALEKFVKENR